MEPWERLTDESAKAFDAFTKYRDLPVQHRSIRNAAARFLELPVPVDLGQLTPNEKTKLSTRDRMFGEWSARHLWVERAAQYDEWLDEQRRWEVADSIRSMTRRHAAVGQALVAVAERELRQILGMQDNGARGPGRPINREDRVVVSFAVEGARLERAAYGIGLDGDAELARRDVVQDVTAKLLTEDPDVAEQMARLALAQSRARRRAEEPA